MIQAKINGIICCSYSFLHGYLGIGLRRDVVVIIDGSSLAAGGVDIVADR